MIKSFATYYRIFLPLLIVALLPCVSVNAQNNGNPLLYQGVLTPEATGVRAKAFGGALTGRADGIHSLWANPAAITGTAGLQIQVSGFSNSSAVRENGVWYPGSPRDNLSLLLDGVITPTEEQSGEWSSDLIDLDYENGWKPEQFGDIVTGDDPYSEDVADYKHDESSFVLGSAAVLFPVRIGDHQITAAASFSQQFVFNNDWNGTHLDPHFGAPGVMPDVDTLRSNWSVFDRQRNGTLNTVRAALSYQVLDELSIGVAVDSRFGETDDYRLLDRKGYLLFENTSGKDDWSYTMDDFTDKVEGSSSFSSFTFDIGLLYSAEKFEAGINIKLPHTMKRDYDYAVMTGVQPDIINAVSGTDEIDLPAVYSAGVSFNPHENVHLMLSYLINPLSQTEYNLTYAQVDNRSRYLDQRIIGLGFEWQAHDAVALMAGYRNASLPFAGESNAIDDRGPVEESITAGLSVSIFMGTLDAVYEYRTMQYFDAYVNNRAFVRWSQSNLGISYTVSL